MSPPPPPLGPCPQAGGLSLRPRARRHRTRPAPRAALAQGRWSEVRALLAGTGDDWDRRGHRVIVLAEEPYSAAWARDWLLAEPDSADAAVLLAFATGPARPARQGQPGPGPRGLPDAAAPGARRPHALARPAHAGARAPAPTRRRVRLFDEVRHRHPDHHHAHHLMVARLAERRTERRARTRCTRSTTSPPGPPNRPPPTRRSPILPVVAHAERYRVLAAAGHEPADPAASGHWTGRRARQVMKAAFDWWLEWEREDHPRRRVDLNFLAHAKVCEGRRRRGRRPLPPHRPARHPGPLVVPGPRPAQGLPRRARQPRSARPDTHAAPASAGTTRTSRAPTEGQPRHATGSSSTAARPPPTRHQHLQGAGARAARRPPRHGGPAALRPRRDRAPSWSSPVSCPPHSR